MDAATMDAATMPSLVRGRYRARVAEDAADLAAAQQLRHLVFVRAGGAVPPVDGRPGESDAYDAACLHVLVEDLRDATPVCCFRMMDLADGGNIGQSYSASQYDLAALGDYAGRMVEIGRFCIHPDHCDGDVLRVAWGAVTRFVDARGVRLLFGCSSFAGTDPARYRDAFALLRAGHLAPVQLRPRVKAPDVFRFARRLRRPPDKLRALRTMPPLLRTYLAMGGWVSDHAVVDRAMNTLHVFTGVEIAAIPPARARLLRAVAG